ncbi:MAG: hypothetical protein JKY25_05465 [Robiginitomaculum sp.]|nr:hypothetical protein [Robiginitomaculum sp.]
MTNTYSINDILKPLALTVIIDNKVRDPELSEFIVQAEGILELLGHGDIMEPQDVLAWFHEHEKTLVGRIKDTRKNTYILTALTRFKDDDMAIEAMYDAMLAISISDKEYHVDESDLVKSAASLWGYERPPFKVIGRG